MVVKFTGIEFWLNSDFSLRIVCTEALTGKTVKFVIRKELEDATAVYSVTSGITFATVTTTDDSADIPITASGTTAMEEGEYYAAVWRTDTNQQRPLAAGTIIAMRAAAPP